MAVSRENQDRRKIQRLEREMKKMKKQECGPRPAGTMSTSLVLGTVHGSTHENLARQLRVWLNPCQLKPPTTGNTATPLSIRGSQYDLWKPNHVQLNFQPLVGPSIVAGSVCLADLDQEASAAKPENIDTVKAKPHCELPLGRRKTWVIPKRFLAGPRDGWWYVDANEAPSQALGPALDVWTYMETRNLLNVSTPAPGGVPNTETSLYTGPLFLVELKVSYYFANYNPKPSLSKLYVASGVVETSTESGPKLMADTDGNLVVSVPANLARELEPYETRAADSTQKTKSETVWALVGDAVAGIADVLGPWGWLLKGGWWVVRKIFGAPTRDGETTYVCYSSVEDALRDNPIKVSTGTSKPIPLGRYRWKQITSPNLNSQNSPDLLMVAGAPEQEKYPPQELFLPSNRPVSKSELMLPIYYWQPAHSFDLPGLFQKPESGSKTDWTNILVFFSIPKIQKITLKDNKGTSLQTQQYMFRIRPKDIEGDTPLYGSQGFQFTIPFLNWTDKTKISTWYWAEFTTATSFFPGVGVDQVGIPFNKQGLLHTKQTLCQAFRTEAGKKSQFNLQITPFKSADPVLKWGSWGWGFENLMDHVKVDMYSQDAVFWPVALWGSTQSLGLMVIMPNTNRIGVLFSSPFPQTPTSEIVTGFPKGYLPGGDQAIWGSFCWPSEISVQWGQKWNQQRTFEREFLDTELVLPPPPSDDFNYTEEEESDFERVDEPFRKERETKLRK